MACVGCIYWRRFYGFGSNAVYACHYILDTGKVRGNATESCTKKKAAEVRNENA